MGNQIFLAIVAMGLHSRALCAKIKCRLQPSFNNRVMRTFLFKLFVCLFSCLVSFLCTPVFYSGFSFLGSFSAFVCCLFGLPRVRFPFAFISPLIHLSRAEFYFSPNLLVLLICLRHPAIYFSFV